MGNIISPLTGSWKRLVEDFIKDSASDYFHFDQVLLQKEVKWVGGGFSVSVVTNIIKFLEERNRNLITDVIYLFSESFLLYNKDFWIWYPNNVTITSRLPWSNQGSLD